MLTWENTDNLIRCVFFTDNDLAILHDYTKATQPAAQTKTSKMTFYFTLTEPYKLSSVMSCCGGEVYNTSVSVCCQRSSSIKEVVAKVRPDDTACCWKTQTPYNHYNEKCTDKGITRSYRRLQPSSCPICDTALSKALCKKRFGKYKFYSLAFICLFKYITYYRASQE